MNKRLIIPRRSDEEITFAVIDFRGCQELELLPKLRLVIQQWKKTDEGRQVFDTVCSNGDFNVGDLANSPVADHSSQLAALLRGVGITYLAIDVYSQEGVAPTWDFDTSMEHE